MYIGLHVKLPYYCLILMKLAFFSTDFRKIRTEFHENPSSGNRAVPCGHDGNSHFPKFCEWPTNKDFRTGLTNIPSIMIKV